MAADQTGSGAAATDDELLEAAQRGDPRALEALLVRYQPHLYRFGLRMCGNPEDAGDVAQESLIAMARSLRDFRGEASVSSWLYTIARRFCIKTRRRSKFAPPREDSLDGTEVRDAEHLADPGPTPEQSAATKELERALTAAIGKLDPGHREVLVLRDVEGLKAAQVAGVLGISVEAVKSRLHRARLAVRKELAPALGHAPLATSSELECPDILALLSQHLEGDVEPRICAVMEAHLARCPRCRADCESLRRALSLCRELPAPQVPAAVAESIRTAMRTFLDSRASGSA